MAKISVAFPVYNEEGNLKPLYAEVKQALSPAAEEYELIFVDNGSTDGSLRIIRELAAQDSRIRYISLSRNFGHQNALVAGMSRATGDAVITMDADLQHPAQIIPQMIERWKSGFEVVYTIKKDLGLPMLHGVLVKSFYAVVSKFSGMVLNLGESDFRLLDRKVVDAIVAIPEYHKFLRGLVKWVGFKQCGLEYSVRPRLSGHSKFSYRKLVFFALDGIFSFSRYPLRIVTFMSLVVAFLSFLYILFVLTLEFLKLTGAPIQMPLPPGWATLAVSVFFLGSTQLVVIGILGEYIGRLFVQTKGRPPFIVRESGGNEPRG